MGVKGTTKERKGNNTHYLYYIGLFSTPSTKKREQILPSEKTGCKFGLTEDKGRI